MAVLAAEGDGVVRHHEHVIEVVALTEHPIQPGHPSGAHLIAGAHLLVAGDADDAGVSVVHIVGDPLLSCGAVVLGEPVEGRREGVEGTGPAVHIVIAQQGQPLADEGGRRVQEVVPLADGPSDGTCTAYEISHEETEERVVGVHVHHQLCEHIPVDRVLAAVGLGVADDDELKLVLGSGVYREQ